MIHSSKTNCPIFVNYHKDDNISSTTKYEDRFINNSEFESISKSKRTLNSPDVKLIINSANGLRLPLFIKKNNDEGLELYFMGDITPVEDRFMQATMPDGTGKLVSVVKMNFLMNHPVEDSMYEYLTNNIDFDSPENSEPIPSNDHLFSFRILPADEVNQYVNSIPLYDIKAAAGNFSDLQINPETEWIQLNRPFKYSEDYFVCKVTGESMNKIIPNNSWCLFKKDTGGSRSGKTVLVHQTNIQDADFGSGFTVKLYESKKTVTEEIWGHDSIILKPQSTLPKYKDLVLVDEDLVDFKVIGIFVEVLN